MATTSIAGAQEPTSTNTNQSEEKTEYTEEKFPIFDENPREISREVRREILSEFQYEIDLLRIPRGFLTLNESLMYLDNEEIELHPDYEEVKDWFEDNVVDGLENMGSNLDFSNTWFYNLWPLKNFPNIKLGFRFGKEEELPKELRDLKREEAYEDLSTISVVEEEGEEEGEFTKYLFGENYGGKVNISVKNEKVATLKTRINNLQLLGLGERNINRVEVEYGTNGSIEFKIADQIFPKIFDERLYFRGKIETNSGSNKLEKINGSLSYLINGEGRVRTRIDLTGMINEEGDNRIFAQFRARW